MLTDPEFLSPTELAERMGKRFNTLFLKEYFGVLRFDYERAFRIKVG
jgi:hypothetical protein